MKERTIFSQGNPGSFDLTDKDTPGYYIARASHEVSTNLYNLQSDGFKFRQMEDSDITSYKASVLSFLVSLVSWFDNAVAAANEGLPIPECPLVPEIPSEAGIPGVFISLLIKLALDIALQWLEEKLNPNTEALEIARVLKQAFIGEIEEEEYPLIEQMANTPLEIIVSKQGDYQDFLYSDRPVT